MTISGATGMFAAKSNQSNQSSFKISGEGIDKAANTPKQDKTEAKDRKTIDASGWQSVEPASLSDRKAQAQSEAFKISMAVFHEDMRADDKRARLKADSARHSDDVRYQQEMSRIAKENFNSLREANLDFQNSDTNDTLNTLLHAYDVFSRPGDEFTEYKGVMSTDVLQRTLTHYANSKPDSGDTDEANEYGYQMLYNDFGDEFNSDERAVLINVGRFGMSDSIKDALDRFGAERSFHNHGIDSLKDVKKDELTLKAASREKRKSNLMKAAGDAAKEMTEAANKEVISAAMSESIDNMNEKAEELVENAEDKVTDDMPNEDKPENKSSNVSSGERFEAEYEGQAISSDEHARSRIEKLVSAMGLSLEDIKGGMVDNIR